MEEEEEEKGDSPGDLRYETLIKIISSASVGCRGAYTPASRECNDFNGNNSVKDGCSRATVPNARPPPALPVPREREAGGEESRTGVTSSFGRGGIPPRARL